MGSAMSSRIKRVAVSITASRSGFVKCLSRSKSSNALIEPPELKKRKQGTDIVADGVPTERGEKGRESCFGEKRLLTLLVFSLAEIVQLDFQSSGAAWKHADVMAYHALLYAHYHVPIHTIIVLLCPEAAHANMNGLIRYAPRPGRGSMELRYEVVRLWERPAEELLRADLGVVPLAMLGRLPEELALEEGLTVIAQRLAERITKEAPPDRARKLLTDAYLLTGLRLRRDAAARIFRGVRAMQESDTYLAILEEGQEKATRASILAVGEERLGAPDESMKARLSNITDLARLMRMVRLAVKAASWQDILNTP
jgi:hypothetical protein